MCKDQCSTSSFHFRFGFRAFSLFVDGAAAAPAPAGLPIPFARPLGIRLYKFIARNTTKRILTHTLSRRKAFAAPMASRPLTRGEPDTPRATWDVTPRATPATAAHATPWRRAVAMRFASALAQRLLARDAGIALCADACSLRVALSMTTARRKRVVCCVASWARGGRAVCTSIPCVT